MTWEVWACKNNSRCIPQEILPVSGKLVFCCVSGKHNTATGQTQFNIQNICTPKSWWSLYKTKITMKCWVGQSRVATYSPVNMNFIQIDQKVTFWQWLSAFCVPLWWCRQGNASSVWAVLQATRNLDWEMEPQQRVGHVFPLQNQHKH